VYCSTVFTCVAWPVLKLSVSVSVFLGGGLSNREGKRNELGGEEKRRGGKGEEGEGRRKGNGLWSVKPVALKVVDRPWLPPWGGIVIGRVCRFDCWFVCYICCDFLKTTSLIFMKFVTDFQHVSVNFWAVKDNVQGRLFRERQTYLPRRSRNVKIFTRHRPGIGNLRQLNTW